MKKILLITLSLPATLLLAAMGGANDLVINDDSQNQQVTIDGDTEYDSVDINNTSADDDKDYYALVTDGAELNVTNTIKIVAPNDTRTGYMKFQDGASLNAKSDVEIQDDGYILSQGGSVNIEGAVTLYDTSSLRAISDATFTTKDNKVELHNSSYIDVDHSTFTMNGQLNLNDDSYVNINNGTFTTGDNDVDLTDYSYILVDSSTLDIAKNLNLDKNATVKMVDDDSVLIVRDKVTLDENSTILSYGDGGSLTFKDDVTLNTRTQIYSKDSDVVFEADVTLNDDSIISSSDAQLNFSNITATDNAYITSSSGDIVANDVTLDSNASIYTKGENSIKLNSVDLSNSSYVFANADVTIETDAVLKDDTYVESNQSNLSISGETTLSNNAALYGLGDESKSVTLAKVTMSDDSKIYSESSRVTLSGDLSMSDNTKVTSNSADLIFSNITATDNAYITSSSGDIVANDVTLDSNASIYTKGENSIKLNSVDLSNSSYVFANADVTIETDAVLKDDTYVESNQSNLSISGETTLSNNAALYGLGDESKSVTLAKVTMSDDSKIYSESSRVTLSGDLSMSDNSSLSSANATIELENVFLKDNAKISVQDGLLDIKGDSYLENGSIIYGSGSGDILLEGDNYFYSKDSGIYVDNKNAYSDIDINVTKTLSLYSGAYVVASGRSKIDINSLIVTDEGYVKSDNSVTIDTIKIVEDQNFVYALFSSNYASLEYTTLIVPDPGNITLFSSEETSSYLKVYKDVVDPSVYGFVGEEKKKYEQLGEMLNQDKRNDPVLYDTLNYNLTKDEFLKAFRSMSPELSGNYISTSMLNESVLSNIGNHLYKIRDFNQVPLPKEFVGANVWIKPFVTHDIQNQVGTASGYSAYGSGLVVGVDKLLSSSMLYGVALSFGTSHITGTLSQSDTASRAITLYFSKYFGSSFLEGYLTKSFNQINQQRIIWLDDASREASSSYGSGYMGAKMVYGHKFGSKHFEFTPFGSLFGGVLSTDTYTETGAGMVDLEVSNRDVFELSAKVGSDIGYRFYLQDGFSVMPNISLGYKKVLKQQAMQSTASFEGSSDTFHAYGIELDDYAFEAQGGIHMMTPDKLLEYRLDASLEKSNNFKSYKGSVSVRIRF